jgi:hypothetical protein
LHGYTDLITCANCSWIMVLISFERWFSVCRPFIKSRLFTYKNAFIYLFTIFISSLLLFLYFPFSLRIIESELSHAKECKIVYKFVYNLFGLFSVLIVYFLPYLILIILNVMIVLKLRLRPLTKSYSTSKNQKLEAIKAPKSTNDFELKDLKESLSLTGMSNLTDIYTMELDPITIKKRRMNKTLKTDRNLSITLVTIALTYVILTVPFQSLWIYEYCFKNSNEDIPITTEDVAISNRNSTMSISENISEYEESLEMTLKGILFNVKNMNYLINFALYSALSKMFQHEFAKIIYGLKSAFFHKNGNLPKSEQTA